MNESEEEGILLESTFELNNEPFAVKLTAAEIQWKSLANSSNEHNSEPFLKTRYNQLQQLFYESNTPDKVYYRPVSQTDPDDQPVVLLPLSKPNVSNLLSCCSRSDQEFPSSLCYLCGRHIKNEMKALSLREVAAVVLGDSKGRNSQTDVGQTAFTVWAISRTNKHRWSHSKIVFHSLDAGVMLQWVNKINELISQPDFYRPKSLLVFVNPISGRRKAVKIFREKVAPLFHLAKLTTQVIETERRYHARDILQTYNLHDIDGIVSVGGDGLFAEIVDGLLTRTLKEDGTDLITVDTVLLQPRLRIGIIPAGSTDTVSYSTQGFNDPITSALHIILGDSLALDVGLVFHNRQFLRYNVSFFGYGYYGDCILDSEQNRWMGPKRYDWEGFKKVIAKRSYKGEISFLLSPDKDSHPCDGTSCKVGCQVCNPTTDLLASVGSSSGQSFGQAFEGEENQWQTIKSCFTAVNSFLISCRCRFSLDGPAPAAHLGNGCSDLVLVHDCSRMQYVQHLYRCTTHTPDQFDFPFIQVFRVRRFKFRPVMDDGDDGRRSEDERLHSRAAPPSSVWNCDGEVVDEPVVEYIIQRQLIKIFARGVEDEEKDHSGCCSCMPYRNE